MSRATPEDRRFLPTCEDIPIPEDVKVGESWPEGLQELAFWIGACDALRLCDAMGGEHTYFSSAQKRSVLAGILSPEKCAIITRIYGGTRFTVPTAKKEIRQARRAAVIASVRAKTMTGSAAAQIIGTSRTYMAYLINRTTEGVGMAPIVLPEPKALSLLKQAADNVVAQLGAAGVSPAIVAGAWASIMAAWGSPAGDLSSLARAPSAPPIGDPDGE